MVLSTGISPRSDAPHCSSVWNSTGCADEIGYVEPGQNFFGRLGVVIGRTADQREAGQRYHRVDHAAAVLHEEALDCRPLVEAAGKGRNDAQSLALRRPRSRRHSGRSFQPADRTAAAEDQRRLSRWRRQAADRRVSAIRSLMRGMIDADVGIFDRWPRLCQLRAAHGAVRRRSGRAAGEPYWRCSAPSRPANIAASGNRRACPARCRE